MYPSYSATIDMKAHKLASTTAVGVRRSGSRVLWGLRHSLPTTEQLLTSGGDARIALAPNKFSSAQADAPSNQYGCPPRPDAAMVALGSCTASIISVAGFAAAELLRSRLLLAVQMELAAQVYARELARQQAELALLCGVTDLSDLKIVFGTSGTDLHTVAAKRCASQAKTSVLTITVDAPETGSGVHAALTGVHAGQRAAAPVSVALRLPDGSLRASQDVDAVVEALVVAAVAAGKRVLLVAVDVSKTGLIAPSAACIAALKRRHVDSLDVLVDACQFRIAPDTLRAYLNLGCMVALTGSKFVTGPAFSGALLLPKSDRQGARKPRVTAPAGADAMNVKPDEAANFGLALRWEAALHELREFRAVPEAQVVAFLARYAAAVREHLAQQTSGESLFEALPVAPLDRQALGAGGGWDGIQTIFPFVPHHPASRGGAALTADETDRLYRALHQGGGELRCQLGQPVACGHRNGAPISALRLCASARLAVEATTGDNADGVINRTLAALDKTAALLRRGAY